MKLIIHTYRINTDSAEGAKEYSELQAKILSHGYKPFSINGHTSTFHPDKYEGEHELDATHLFADQFNTMARSEESENGSRVHEWMTFDYTNRYIREGYWIEPCEERKALLHSTFACGWCGHQTKDKGDGFHHGCLGCQYITKADLHLTKLKRLTFKGNRAPLTSDEREAKIAEHVDAQINGKAQRDEAALQKATNEAEEEYEKAIQDAKDTREGKLWILNHIGNTDNIIYYSHTKTWAIGWRTPVTSPELKKEWEDKMKGFPQTWEFSKDKR